MRTLRTSASTETSRLLGIVAAVVAVATLYFARVVFIPLALALLFTLLLTPVVTFLEKIWVPRLLAILLVVACLATLLGFMGWRSSQQFIQLTDQLPTYKKTLIDKIHALRGPSSQGFNNATNTVKELEKEIGTVAPGSVTATDSKRTPPTPGSSPAHPLNVEVVPPTNPLEALQNMLGPLATVGVVIIFAIFMLMGREDLRNRMIRLAGRGHLKVITEAIDDATRRINRYLFLQLVINSVYGLIIGISLQLIGIPNASLWGVAAGVLRFLPYVGPPLAALMPVVLSLAIFPGWHHALLTAGLFVVLEILVANFIEPYAYGTHIGLSPLAILVAAVFWTLIWGFPGLVLSTPLTVCLVVMGRYVPSLGFLAVLLGDEPVLSPPAQYYQRLLAGDQTEAKQVLEQFLEQNSLEELYNALIIPALNLAEQDRHRNELDEDTQNFIYQSTSEFAEELAADSTSELVDVTPEESPRTAGEIRNGGHIEVLCIPARDDADAVAALLLSQLLVRQGHAAECIPIGARSEMLAQVGEFNPEVVFISALPPFAVGHAQALYTRLRAQSPNLEIVVCLWHFEGDSQKNVARFKLAKGHALFTTLPQVLQHMAFRKELIVSGEKQAQPLS
jgi:predicted PurR-regulated permease PerM